MAIWVYGYLGIWVCTENPDFDLNGYWYVESVNSIVKLEPILQLFVIYHCMDPISILYRT